MGYMRAAEMITFAGFDLALRDHLQHNLFPPTPATHQNVALAKAAIEAVVDGDPGRTVATGIGPYAADEVVEGWRLEVFVDALEIERGAFEYGETQDAGDGEPPTQHRA